MAFIIDQFKKAGKGDSFRNNEKADKYNDKIAQLNSLGANQYSKLTTNTLNRISKTTTSPTNTKGGTIPGVGA
jgi:hypothetical protein